MSVDNERIDWEPLEAEQPNHLLEAGLEFVVGCGITGTGWYFFAGAIASISHTSVENILNLGSCDIMTRATSPGAITNLCYNLTNYLPSRMMSGNDGFAASIATILCAAGAAIIFNRSMKDLRRSFHR